MFEFFGNITTFMAPKLHSWLDVEFSFRFMITVWFIWNPIVSVELDVIGSSLSTRRMKHREVQMLYKQWLFTFIYFYIIFLSSWGAYIFRAWSWNGWGTCFFIFLVFGSPFSAIIIKKISSHSYVEDWGWSYSQIYY